MIIAKRGVPVRSSEVIAVVATDDPKEAALQLGVRLGERVTKGWYEGSYTIFHKEVEERLGDPTEVQLYLQPVPNAGEGLLLALEAAPPPGFKTAAAYWKRRRNRKEKRLRMMR